jgi:hypothetical protein
MRAILAVAAPSRRRCLPIASSTRVPPPLLPRSAHSARAAAALVLAGIAATSSAETFVLFGTQPDGSEIFVQASPAALRGDGRYQGWFRTLPKAPKPITDEFGFPRPYVDFLALNVADCATRRMASASMHYRDDKGVVVARFELPSRDLQYREVRPGTLGENMLVWLCSPRPPSAKVPSAASQSPF